MDGSTNLCQVSTGQEQDWKDLYNSAFPADERTPLEELQRLLEAGSILLHRTTNKSGELLCFSIVYPMSNFALLSYIASDSTKRSTGIGSKHMKRLLEILKSGYPEFLGLVLEIESTRQQGLEAADKTARQRRLAFYQRLGAKRLCRTYVWPSYSLKGTYRLAELMWFDFDPATIDDPHLPGIIKELYTKGYGAQADDPILELVVHQFKCSDKTGSAAVICPVEPAEGDKKTAEKKDAPAKADHSASTEKPAEAVKTDAVTPAKDDSTTVRIDATSAKADAVTATPATTDATVVPAADADKKANVTVTPATTDATVVKADPVQTAQTSVTPDNSPAPVQETAEPVVPLADKTAKEDSASTVAPIEEKDKKSKQSQKAKSKQTKPDETNPDETNPAKPDETKPDQPVTVTAPSPQGEKGGNKTKDGA